MVGIRWWLACGVLGKNKEESSISAFPAGQMLLDRRVPLLSGLILLSFCSLDSSRGWESAEGPQKCRATFSILEKRCMKVLTFCNSCACCISTSNSESVILIDILLKLMLNWLFKLPEWFWLEHQYVLKIFCLILPFFWYQAIPIWNA